MVFWQTLYGAENSFKENTAVKYISIAMGVISRVSDLKLLYFVIFIDNLSSKIINSDFLLSILVKY